MGCSWRGIEVCLAGSYGRRPTRLGAARRNPYRSAVYLIGAAASAKIHAAIEKLPRGPRGVVEGGLDFGDWYDVCAAPLMAVFTPVVPVPRVGVLSCPEIFRS